MIRISGCFVAIIYSLLAGSLDAQVAVAPGGAGAPAGTGVNGANNAGGDAIGLGCGGGGGSWWGGTGGAGKYGGGGGGAGGYFSLGAINWAGGDGGQGVVVIAYYNGASFVSSVVLISGTAVTVGSGITSAKVWAIGGGGGAGGSTENDGTAGGGGGAGGVAYVSRAVSPGNAISYSLGSGGRAGHGSSNSATSGGSTSATIAGTTIYAYGGSPGQINSLATAAGGTFSGGDGGANGGTGCGSTGDDGGGGGGAIGGANGTHNGNDGGTGANSIDVSGLFTVCSSASNPAAPGFTSFTPTAGLTGTTVTITGSNFSGLSNVLFGGFSATSMSLVSSTEISAVVSSAAVTGSVSLVLSHVTLSKPIYFFTAPVAPAIDSFSPTSASEGDLVTISGNKFLGVTSVSFGGTAALSFSVHSDFQIVATVGAGTSGSVSVTSSSGTGTKAGFTWVPSIPADPASVTASSNPICNGFSTVLTANGSDGTVYWYTGNCGGTQVSTGITFTISPATTTTYYARNYNNSQFSTGCASLEITVGQPSYFAMAPTVSELQATGSGIKWYAAASQGAPLSTSVQLVGGNHYYATQTINGCESATRIDVTASVDPTPCKPTGSPAQSFSAGASVANLSASGSNIRWYLASSGGPALPSSTLLVNGTHYWASQTIDCTESATRWEVTVTLN